MAECRQLYSVPLFRSLLRMRDKFTLRFTYLSIWLVRTKYNIIEIHLRNICHLHTQNTKRENSVIYLFLCNHGYVRYLLHIDLSEPVKTCGLCQRVTVHFGSGVKTGCARAGVSIWTTCIKNPLSHELSTRIT